VYQYCIARYAPEIADVRQAERSCGMAGAWEKRCRRHWVSRRLEHGSGTPVSTLLEFCADDADCAFEVLDARPASDVLLQIERCGSHLGQLGRDCARHALQRWYLAGPDADELQRVAQSVSSYPRAVGSWLGACVACLEVGRCGGDGPARKSCDREARRLTNKPEGCQRLLKRPAAQVPASTGPGGGGDAAL